MALPQTCRLSFGPTTSSVYAETSARTPGVHTPISKDETKSAGALLAHTGSAVATGVLDAALRRAVTESGGRYTTGIVEKTNAPNLAYKNPDVRAEFAADYEFILGCQLASRRS